MEKPSFAIAAAIRRKNKRMPSGEMKSSGNSEILKGIMAKRMNKGGMCYSKGGMVDHDNPESMDVAPEFYDQDFLSDEEQDFALDQTYPDPDGVEDTEGMGKRGIMATILGRIRARHMGK